MHGSTLLCSTTNPFSNYYNAVNGGANAQNIKAEEIERKRVKWYRRGREEEEEKRGSRRKTEEEQKERRRKTEEELKGGRRKNRIRERNKRDRS